MPFPRCHVCVASTASRHRHRHRQPQQNIFHRARREQKKPSPPIYRPLDPRPASPSITTYRDRDICCSSQQSKLTKRNQIKSTCCLLALATQAEHRMVSPSLCFVAAVSVGVGTHLDSVDALNTKGCLPTNRVARGFAAVSLHSTTLSDRRRHHLLHAHHSKVHMSPTALDEEEKIKSDTGSNSKTKRKRTQNPNNRYFKLSSSVRSTTQTEAIGKKKNDLEEEDEAIIPPEVLQPFSLLLLSQFILFLGVGAGKRHLYDRLFLLLLPRCIGSCLQCASLLFYPHSHSNYTAVRTKHRPVRSSQRHRNQRSRRGTPTRQPSRRGICRQRTKGSHDVGHGHHCRVRLGHGVIEWIGNARGGKVGIGTRERIRRGG